MDDMSAKIIEFPVPARARRDDRGFPLGIEAARTFVGRQYEGLKGISAVELASRHAAMVEAWNVGLPLVAPERRDESDLYRRHCGGYFRDCVRLGVSRRVVGEALVLRGSRKYEIDNAFIDVGSEATTQAGEYFGYAAFEAAMAGV